MTITLSSWNINGIRAISAKEGFKWFYNTDYDVIGFQETKANADQISDELKNRPGYDSFFCSSTVKKGYSGTAVYTRLKPLRIEYELPDDRFKGEGRIIHIEFEKFHFFNGYFPNGGAAVLDDNGKPTGKFIRVPYKMGFFDSFVEYAESLRKDKPIVVCGDFNIAHRAIDLARPKQNERNTGYLPEERAFLDRMVSLGYVDTFRHVHGDIKDCYSWWSYKTFARAKNIGWRIDYFFVSDELKPFIKDAKIESDVMGSDHCPVTLVLDL